MKLEDCLTMGRFCGLSTLEECVVNAQIHYFPILPPEEAAEEYDELNRELAKYDNNEIDIDWDYVDREVERQRQKMEEYFKQNPPQDIDFSVLEKD